MNDLLLTLLAWMAVSLAVLPWQVFAPATDRVRRKARDILVCRTVASWNPTWQGEGSLTRNLLKVGLVLLVPGHKRVFVLAKVCAVTSEDHHVVRYCTCVCRNTACRAQ